MAAATATVTFTPATDVIITQRLSQLGQASQNLNDKIFYKKLLEIQPSRGSTFLGTVVDDTATVIPGAVLDTFTTSLDHLLSAMTRRPELFLPDSELERNQAAILAYIDNPESKIDYTQAPYLSVVRMAEAVIRVMTILNVVSDSLSIWMCNSNCVMWLCCAAVSGSANLDYPIASGQLPYDPIHDYHADAAVIMAASHAIALIPVVFEHRLTAHPTALCILSNLLGSLHPPEQLARWLRHYFSVYQRDYEDYACEPQLVQRAHDSYQRYQPIDMSRRGDLCLFIAELGLHMRREVATSDTSQQTDYAHWWANFYVTYGATQLYRHPDLDQLCQSWYTLDETVDLVAEGVRHWWKLWAHAVDYSFPKPLLFMLHQHTVEWITPATRFYTLSRTVATPPSDTATLTTWHQQHSQQQHIGITNKLLYRQSRIEAAVELNYRETVINLSTCIARTQLSPLGVMTLINTITNKYLEGINVPGTTAVESGIAVAAPVFQMALSGFHHAGSAKSNTVILKRIEESMYATKTKSMDNPSMYLVPAGQLSYHQASYARARLVTMVLNDFVLRSTRMPSYSHTMAWLRLHLDVAKMVQYRTTPYDIAAKLALQMRDVGAVMSPSALHDGYIDVTYKSDDGSHAAVTLETVIIDQMLAAVVKGTVDNSDSVVTGVFPASVEVWTRSVMNITKATVNGITGSIVQLNEMEMTHRGFHPKRIQRILVDILGVDSWMLPYYDVDARQLVLDPRAPAQLDGVPPPGFGWYLFAIHRYDAIPDLKKAIMKAKDENRKLEDDYEKYWREQGELYIRPETKTSLALREWHLETNGTSLLSALNDPLVNPLYSYSSSIHEVNEVLGIAAAGMLQLRSYIELIKYSDNQLDWGHLLVIINYQMAPGEPIPLSHTGYNKSDFNSMTLAGNSYATNNIIQSATSGQSEKVKGFVPEVMMGRRVTAGSGMFDVVMTPQQHTEMKIRIQALRGITRSKGSTSSTVNEAEVEFDGVITEQDNQDEQDVEDPERDIDDYDDAFTKRSGNSIIQNDEQIMRFKGVRSIVAGEFIEDDGEVAPRLTVMDVKQKITKPQERRTLLGNRNRQQTVDWGSTTW